MKKMKEKKKQKIFIFSQKMKICLRKAQKSSFVLPWAKKGKANCATNSIDVWMFRNLDEIRTLKI